MSSNQPDEALAPDYAASIDFLQRWLPRGPWVLTAIVPDKPKKGAATFTDSFGGADLGSGRLLRWLEEQGTKRRRNIYFTPNACRKQSVKKKPTKADIGAMLWLHVDLDPRAGEDMREEQERILKLLQDPSALGIPKPTAIVFSGGGYQGFWRLDGQSAILFGDDPAEKAEAERYNRKLEQLLGGDHTHNVDRVMRLPGTINRPDAKKRAKGRTEALAAVVEFNDGLHNLDGFEKAEPVRAARQGSNGKVPAVEFDEEDASRVQDLDRELPSTVPPVVKRIIACGRDEENGEPERERWSRSQWQWWATCELARQKVKPEVVYSILLDPDWGISAHVRDQSDPEDYARRQIERAFGEVEAVPDGDGGDFQKDKDGKPYANLHNARLAIEKLGVALEFDEFAERSSATVREFPEDGAE